MNEKSILTVSTKQQILRPGLELHSDAQLDANGTNPPAGRVCLH